MKPRILIRVIPYNPIDEMNDTQKIGRTTGANFGAENYYNGGSWLMLAFIGKLRCINVQRS